MDAGHKQAAQRRNEIALTADEKSLDTHRFFDVSLDGDGFLLLSSHRPAQDDGALEACCITHVLNVAKDVPPPERQAERLGVLFLPLYDAPGQALPFEQCYAFIEKARSRSSFSYSSSTSSCSPSHPPARPPRLVCHCNAGISRSASICIYYLMRRHNITVLHHHPLLNLPIPPITPCVLGSPPTFCPRLLVSAARCVRARAGAQAQHCTKRRLYGAADRARRDTL